jgi:hypothetical protein
VQDLLNAQTGRIGWSELELPFARGVLLLVAPGLDLIEVAARVVRDDRRAVEAWTDSGGLRRPQLDDARRWAQRPPEFWAVVAAPWVLAQEIPPAPED